MVPITFRCAGGGGDGVVDIVEHKGASGFDDVGFC